MTDKLKKIITDEMAKLPKEHQEAMNAFDWVKITEEVGKKYSLDDDKINNLQTETLLVLVGLQNVSLYTDSVEENVSANRTDAEKIKEEILQKVFVPINDMLVKKIKEGLKTKRIKWSQNLDFILSGGDYSSFMEKRETPQETVPLSSSSVPMKPKMSDIKTKLII